MDNTAFLVLSDGTIYKGKRFGAFRDTVGETVFTTAATGYLEALTDAAYTGQMLVCAFPMLGNYGAISEDLQSDKAGVSALIVREYSETPSNFRCEGTIDALLKKMDVPAICGIDTRALVRRLRSQGVMNGCICSDPAEVDLKALEAWKMPNAVEKLSCKEAYAVGAENAGYKVAVLDLGLGGGAAKALARRGCAVKVFPYNTSAEEILASAPNGILVSGGVGDPNELEAESAAVKALVYSGKPVLGIGHGHLLMAQSAGLAVEKMKYGHRGENQPVRDNATGRIYITAQNHGYAVSEKSGTSAECRLAYSNCNDKGCEGLVWTNLPAVSFQFDPLAVAGPQDCGELLNGFFALMDNAKKED